MKEDGKMQKVALGALTESRVAQDGPSTQVEFTYIDISSIDRETKRIIAPKIISTKYAPSRAKQVLKAGDVVVSMTRPNLNAVALVPPYLDGTIGSTGFHVLRAKDAEPGFLFYAVQTTGFIDAMCQKVQGALYPAVRPKDILSFCIPYFSLTEQRSIVAEIEKQFARLDAGVAALKRIQANLKRYRASVLKSACEGKLVPTEVEIQKDTGGKVETGEQLLKRILAERKSAWEAEQRAKAIAKAKDGKLPASFKLPPYREPTAPDTAKLGALPEGWTWATPSQLSAAESYSLAIGPFGSNLKVSDYTDSGVPLIFVRNIRAGFFAQAKEVFITEEKAAELNAHQVKGGDILVTKMGAPPGDTCIYPDAGPMAVITADCIKFRPSTLLERRIIVFAMNSLTVKPQIAEITKGVAQMKVSLGRFEGIALPLPPLAEQLRIVAAVEQRLSVVEQLETVVSANLQRATCLRQSILQKAFSGEMVLPNLNKIFAELPLTRVNDLSDEVETAKTREKPKDKTNMQSKPVTTLEELLQRLDSLGGAAAPDRLLAATGIVDEEVETFFDLLREGKNNGALIVPMGISGNIKRSIR
ncbi:MAG: restriction endonuclease subunit S [Verrucomicrobiota bacterium]|nr:restriction endonuclease subunit S [Verrucomicrobiota bacterium]